MPKYISRKFVNGKWVYQYDTPSSGRPLSRRKKVGVGVGITYKRGNLGKAVGSGISNEARKKAFGSAVKRKKVESKAVSQKYYKARARASELESEKVRRKAVPHNESDAGYKKRVKDQRSVVNYVTTRKRKEADRQSRIVRKRAYVSYDSNGNRKYTSKLRQPKGGIRRRRTTK